VISAHIHRMLHHADVGQIRLADIRNNELPIRINGADYRIRWRPEHARLVEQAAAAAAAAAAVAPIAEG
jgi:5-methylcytosine-specific restriction enzyme A